MLNAACKQVDRQAEPQVSELAKVANSFHSICVAQIHPGGTGYNSASSKLVNPLISSELNALDRMTTAHIEDQ